MASYLRWLNSNVPETPLAHLASAAVLIASVIFEVMNSRYVGQDGAFISFIPAVIIIVYLEGRSVAIAVTIVMAVAGLWGRQMHNVHISPEAWMRAGLFLVSGGIVASIFPACDKTFERRSACRRAGSQPSRRPRAVTGGPSNALPWALQTPIDVASCCNRIDVSVK
jgi:hypothetical protein